MKKSYQKFQSFRNYNTSFVNKILWSLYFTFLFTSFLLLQEYVEEKKKHLFDLLKKNSLIIVLSSPWRNFSERLFIDHVWVRLTLCNCSEVLLINSSPTSLKKKLKSIATYHFNIKCWCPYLSMLLSTTILVIIFWDFLMFY